MPVSAKEMFPMTIPMNRAIASLLSCGLLGAALLGSSAQAQLIPEEGRLPGSMQGGQPDLPWTQYGKHIESRNTVAALGATLFGDEVNLYNGALSFRVTDVSLPGNFAIPVEITRTLSVTSRHYDMPNDSPFADWDLDIPRIEGTFGIPLSGNIWPSRCSSEPPNQVTVDGGANYQREEFWSGTHAQMPGGGELLSVDPGSLTPKPVTAETYRWVTPALTYISCLPGDATDDDEGFLAITTDGTRYTFTHKAEFWESTLIKPGGNDVTSLAGTLDRRRVALYVKTIEDRFGNTVTYNYANEPYEPVKLVSIVASDGRTITLTHHTDNNGQTYNNLPLIKSIFDGAQTWLYDYTNMQEGRQSLRTVTLPDQTMWDIDLRNVSGAEIRYSAGDSNFVCNQNMTSGGMLPASPEGALSTADPGSSGNRVTGTITHPSGAEGTFVITHGGAPSQQCAQHLLPILR
jgi:hypothetical protein